MLHFKYPPLDPKVRQMRLVTLEPGAWTDPIGCHLDVVSFDTHPPPYEALSYVWGDAAKRKQIQLNDQSFEVTENLWMALRRLRDSAASRVLWIDAICINQTDNDEKSQQVAMMGDIYGRCREALLWLGEDQCTAETGSKSTTAGRACELLDMFVGDRHFNELPCFSYKDGQRLDISEQYTESFRALALLLDAPWWKRIWVVQEMVLPAKVRFLYASEEFSYDTLRALVKALDTHATTCCKDDRMALRALAFDPLMVFQEQVEPMVFTRETWKQQSRTTLFDLRRRFSAFQATNKRDLFYALLGLVTHWGSAAPLRPNYELPVKDAITQAVFKCVSEQDGLGSLQGERRFRTDEDMPSWVPDANFTSVPSQWVLVEQRRRRMASGFSASASLHQDASELGLAADGALLPQSIAVDEIAEVGPVFEPLEHFERSPDVMRRWMEMVGLGAKAWPERPPPPGSLEDAFWRTMLNDAVELDTNASPFYRRAGEGDYVELRNLWEMLLGLQPLVLGLMALSISDASYESLIKESPKTIYHLLVCLWQRRMFVTRRKLIGLAPANACPGDQVHVLLGCPVPFVLRPVQSPFRDEDHSQPIPCYTVIGNGYVHDVMFGKAFENGGERNIRTIALR